MRLKGLAVAGMACTMAFGTAVSAEAKPADSKVKQCKQHGKKLRCETTDGTVTTSVCPTGFDPAQLIELGPGMELADLNGNRVLCYSATLGVIDDTPAS
jgi:hypothetical protein